MPAMTDSGTFTVIRSPQAHDYAGNGSPDLFARLANGDLDAIDTLWDDATGQLVVAQTRGSTVWTGDWNRYDRVEAVGDIAGSPAVDIVARDKAGSLWLHVGDPMATAEPVRIGGGWNTYTQLNGGSDLTGDGRADLVAVDTAGDLYLYTATGSTKAPFAPRKKIGYSWGIYNQLTATGNIGGGPAGDLVARDNGYGKLWLYLGKGDGTFAPRTQIGGLAGTCTRTSSASGTAPTRTAAPTCTPGRRRARPPPTSTPVRATGRFRSVPALPPGSQ
ncbi:hypothetical protein STANM309S_06143 [Streptomyces tanashiensis]